jgi:hypothetical protein
MTFTSGWILRRALDIVPWRVEDVWSFRERIAPRERASEAPPACDEYGAIELEFRGLPGAALTPFLAIIHMWRAVNGIQRALNFRHLKMKRI